MQRLVLLALVLAACRSNDTPKKEPTNQTPTTCNGIAIDAGEACDGTFLAGATCRSLGYGGGTLACNNTCSDYDVTDCTDPECGNNSIEGIEVCDGTDLDGETCVTQGFASGALHCAQDCLDWDTTNCAQAACGNNRKEGTEVCDGTDLAGQTCALQGHGGGTLRCVNCAFDYTQCTGQTAVCGNGAADGTEPCDGNDLRGATCVSLGLGDGVNDAVDHGGTVTCTNCAFVTTACEVQASACSGPDTYHAGGLNTALADGEPCNYVGDCTNGCNSMFYCGPEGTLPTLHDADLPLGRACDADPSCASGYCWQADFTWVCAEPCATPQIATGPGLACQAIAEPTPAPATGSACIPGPGGGDIGDTCQAGEFDCDSGVCLEGAFCTALCDPADATTCPTGSSCELFASDDLFGDVYICVDDTRVTAGDGADPGDPCVGPFDCPDTMVCFDDLCTVLCPNGDECPAGTYCATDFPGAAICQPDTTHVGLGEPCERDTQCPASAVCFDAGSGATCHATCPTGTCAGTQVCQISDSGPQLDTVVSIFDTSGGNTPLATNDDRDGSYFSELTQAVPAGAHDYWLEVTRYPDSPVGPYRLELFTTAPGSTYVDEAASNDTRATAQVVAVPSIVRASFVDATGADDVDAFKVTVTGVATLTVRTDVGQSAVCVDAPVRGPDGSACTADLACENKCFPFNRAAPESFCAKPCTGAADCGTGVCQAFNDTSPASKFCFPAGAVGLGNGAFGTDCDGPQDCASHMCVKHKYGTRWVCGDTCSTADAACATAGMCSNADPIYHTACIPHLGGTVPPGGSCRWTPDCVAGNSCRSERCVPDNVGSRYDPPAPAADGVACNLDSDCAGGSCIGFVCRDPSIVGCADADGVVAAGEICDPLAQPVVTCADVGAGLATQNPTCADTCDGWDLSTCGGLPIGAPCNVDGDCASFLCAAGGNTWVCANPCDGPNNPSCTGQMYGEDVACRTGDGVTYACLPAPGSGAAADPCRSGYFDCASGLCWDAAFCLATCSLSETDCGRNATCVSYVYDRVIDTQLTIVDELETPVAGPNDDINYPGNLWSAASYTNSDASTQLWLKVESSPVIDPAAVGAYQLQCWSAGAPPPFGAPTLESELREPPVPNGSIASAQAIDDLLPRRVQAELDDTGTDADYYRVNVPRGTTITAVTTFPLAQICWPNAELGRVNGAECEFSFECASSACIDSGYCASECTGSRPCETGSVCSRPAESFRDYCFQRRAWGDDCTNAPTSPDGESTPVCPNGVCLTRDGGTTYACSTNCLTNDIGTGCGMFDQGLGRFDGECYQDLDGTFLCVKHLGRSVVNGDACALDGDCQSNCCDVEATDPVCIAQTAGRCARNQ